MFVFLSHLGFGGINPSLMLTFIRALVGQCTSMGVELVYLKISDLS